MATNTAALPSVQESVVDAQGALSVSWRRFLEGLWNRSGRFQEIGVTATSNTNLKFSYRGSDGVVRSGNITLS